MKPLSYREVAILFITDHSSDNQKIVQHIASRYKLIQAHNLDQAKQVIQTNTVHLVLCEQTFVPPLNMQFIIEMRATNPMQIYMLLVQPKQLAQYELQHNTRLVYRYFLHPINLIELSLGIQAAADTYNLRLQNQVLLENKHKLNQQLDEQVRARTAELKEKNARTRQSLQYARGIQQLLLPSEQFFKQNFKGHFVYYKPRDIVSGDFYWAFKSPNSPTVIIVAGDCTGHGVPGAMLSMLAMKTIDSLVYYEHIHRPDQILNQWHSVIRHILRQNENENENLDGMDAAVIRWNYETRVLEYAGAKMPIIFYDAEGANRLNADVKAIGGAKLNDNLLFTLRTIELEQPSLLYLFSDGITDQFGGPNRKKLMTKGFLELLDRIHKLPMAHQHHQIDIFMRQWMRQGTERQLDDQMVIGVLL